MMVRNGRTLSIGHIFRFYYPLALSWLLMGAEGPLAVGVISRMPRPEVGAAAFLLMMSLAIWIESPVIDLLATSTTLARDARSYAQVRRFAWLLVAWVTAAHALIVLTPIYGLLVRNLLGTPAPVAEAARLGLVVMLPWSALIAWRRTLQGVLIRFGETHAVGIGTATRAVAMAAVAIGLYAAGRLPGIVIAAWGLIAGVFAEAAFVHAASRRVVRRELPIAAPPASESELTIGKLARFHLPLTGTTMVNLVALPLVAVALARTPDGVLSMAGYEVASSLVWLFRTITFALPEVVITLAQDDDSSRTLARFSSSVGVFGSAALLALGLSGADVLFFRAVLRAPADAARVAHLALLASVAIPILDALHSYVRGVLTADHQTAVRLVAVGLGTAALVGLLALGLTLRWPGPMMAAIATTASVAAELALLAWALRAGLRSRARPAGEGCGK